MGSRASSRDLSDPGIKPRFLALQADSLPSEPPGKTKNTSVGSLSLLQGIFWTQELKQSPALQVDSCRFFFLFWRQILYQLNYQGSPVSSAQQSNSFLCVSVCIFFLRFFSIIGHYKILNIVPCAIQ